MPFKPLTLNTPPEQAAQFVANDDASLYHGILGADYVLNELDCMSATVISNNKVRINPGCAVLEGHLGRIAYGDYHDLVIENGVSGKNRNDLIVLRFTTTGSTGVDTYTPTVIKGTAGATGIDPPYVKGSLLAGAAQRDFPLYRVLIEGTSIIGVDRLFSIAPTLSEINSKLPIQKIGVSDAVLVNSNARVTIEIQIPGVGASGFPGYGKVPDIVIAVPFNSSGLSAECAVADIRQGGFQALLKNSGGTASYFKVHWIAVWSNL